MDSIGLVDLSGYLAAGATLVAFAQRDMLPMRICALAANVFFVLYGGLGGFYLALALHLILLPLNAKRLWDQVAQTVNHKNVERPATLFEKWQATRSDQRTV